MGETTYQLVQDFWTIKYESMSLVFSYIFFDIWMVDRRFCLAQLHDNCGRELGDQMLANASYE